MAMCISIDMNQTIAVIIALITLYVEYFLYLNGNNDTFSMYISNTREKNKTNSR